MSEEAVQAPEEQDEGAPAWVMTFADLMSLLMCFFVLLLSFSEMEATKFKQMAGSMRMAFGVQRQMEAPDTPMGTSIIAQNFSPGKPEPTPLEEVRQTTSEEKPELLAQEEQQKKIEADASELEEVLKEEIDAGLIEIETAMDQIIIRIQEKGSFPSGSAELNEAFLPIIGKITNKLVEMPGRVVVAGHTDDIPISTFRFRSNWELSAARAASVLHELIKPGGIEPSRSEVKGLADTFPLALNDSRENRAKNRRVEIVILTGEMGGGNQLIEVNPEPVPTE